VGDGGVEAGFVEGHLDEAALGGLEIEGLGAAVAGVGPELATTLTPSRLVVIISSKY
jgi:hypothetical protein